MAQTPWHDLIPYYVARSLPPAQMQAFETQLARDTELRREVDEWRRIAASVWREADAAARHLPPLSPEIYQKLQYRGGAQPVNPTGALPPPRVDRRLPINNSPLMFVAGFLVVFLCGGVMLFSALRQWQQPSVLTTNVAMGTGENDLGGPMNISATPMPTQCLVRFGDAVEGCASVTPSVTTAPQDQTWTPIPRGTSTAVIVRPFPTATPRRVTAQATGTLYGMNLSLQATNEAAAFYTQTAPRSADTVTPWPDYLCIVTNSSGSPRPLYTYADYNAELVGYWPAGETTWVMARTANNWIEISYGQWLPTDGLIFKGPCDSVPAPSPTAAQSSEECTMTNIGPNAVTLYDRAENQAAAINTLPVAVPYRVLTATMGWYEIFYEGRLSWITPGDAVSQFQFTGNCALVPAPSPTYFVPSPTATHTPAATPFQRVAVALQDLTVYEQPIGAASPVIGTMPAGTRWLFLGYFEIGAGIGMNGANVQMPDGRRGWVDQDSVRIESEP